MSPPSSSHLRSSRALAREVPRGTAVDSQLQLGRDLLGISSAFHELTFSRGLLSKNVHPSPASPALVPRERKNCVVHNAAPVTPLPSMHRPPPQHTPGQPGLARYFHMLEPTSRLQEVATLLKSVGLAQIAKMSTPGADYKTPIPNSSIGRERQAPPLQRLPQLL